MAHILVAEFDTTVTSMLEALFDSEGYWVTCVHTPGQLLSAMRGTLHPMIVLFYNRMLFSSTRADEEYPFSIMLREEADLRRHRLIEMAAGPTIFPDDDLRDALRALYDRLGVRHISIPFSLEPLLELVAECASELEPAP